MGLNVGADPAVNLKTNLAGLLALTRAITGWRSSALAITICLVPIILGFVIPVGVLLNFIFSGYAKGLPDATASAIQNTLLVASIGAIIIMLMAPFVGIIACAINQAAWAACHRRNFHLPVMLCQTILAIGVLGVVFGIEQFGAFINDDAIARLLSGTLMVLLFAFILSGFRPMGGVVNAGLKRLPNLMPASQVLGHPFSSSVLRITVPLLHPSILAGLLLAFVDIMKELPMTLLFLRLILKRWPP